MSLSVVFSTMKNSSLFEHVPEQDRFTLFMFAIHLEQFKDWKEFLKVVCPYKQHNITVGTEIYSLFKFAVPQTKLELSGYIDKHAELNIVGWARA